MNLTELLGSIVMGAGVLLMVIVTLSIFRMDFVINRMHVTAIADTLATLLIFIGGSLCKGIHWVDLKLVLILALQWFTVPVCGHMIVQLEYAVVGDLQEHCTTDFSDPKPAAGGKEGKEES
ncbi:MAG: cation:proton antiporter [Candidatus Onthomonas sp.]